MSIFGIDFDLLSSEDLLIDLILKIASACEFNLYEDAPDDQLLLLPQHLLFLLFWHRNILIYYQLKVESFIIV
jgi:hypothetical protein